MQEHLSKFGILEAKHYRLIILLQFLIIAVFTINLAVAPKVNLNTEALGSTYNKTIKDDVKVCLSLPTDERIQCARITGEKISTLIQDPRERLKACLMFRPYSYIYDCQEALAR